MDLYSRGTYTYRGLIKLLQSIVNEMGIRSVNLEFATYGRNTLDRVVKWPIYRIIAEGRRIITTNEAYAMDLMSDGPLMPPFGLL